MQYAHEVSIPLSAATIDLPEWLFTLSEPEYGACARGHRAIGTQGEAARTGMVNVESIGGSLLIQHYKTELAEPDHVIMRSAASRAYLMHLVPVQVDVVWDLQLLPDGPNASRFRCAIDVEMPTIVHLLGLTTGSPIFVKRHLIEETRGFANDITRKHNAKL